MMRETSEALVEANVLLRHLLGVPKPLATKQAAILAAAEDRRVDLNVTALTLAEAVTGAPSRLTAHSGASKASSQ